MRFEQPLQQGLLQRRYKRFLADIETVDGDLLTIHCPNTGSMRNCLAVGEPVWYSCSNNTKRKYPHTWEIATTPAGHLAGINTGRANALVREALERGLVPGLAEYDSLQPEVRFGRERSRIDFLVQHRGASVYVEVKNVTLCENENLGFFPDSISVRGAKHLRELSAMVRAGDRAMLVYCVQHSGIVSVAPARHIDPAYADAFADAMRAGVEVIALGASISPREIALNRILPLVV